MQQQSGFARLLSREAGVKFSFVDINFVFLSITTALLAGLGILVILDDHKSKVNRTFVGFILWFSVWYISVYFENEPLGKDLASIFLRADFYSAAIAIYFLAIFCLNFLSLSTAKREGLLFLPAILLSALSFTNLIVKDIRLSDSGGVQFGFGLLYPLYAVYLFGCLGLGVGVLVYKYRSASSIFKKQIFYILLGLGISIFCAAIISLLLQSLIKVEIFRIGISLSAVILVGSITYALLKYRLLNAKLILTESLVVFILVVLLARALFAGGAADLAADILFLFLISIFGKALVKSVKNEVEQRKKLTELTVELGEANERLKLLDNAKTEFISIASHQLRTPLSINKGYLSMILSGDYGKVDKERKKILDKVYSSNERLITLVNDLLNISRIESGRLEYRFEPVDIKQLVKEIVDGFQMKAKDKGLRLAAKYPPTLPKINADLAKIKEVVSNLLDNAIKYTEHGSIAVGLKNKNGCLFCGVRDTGLGVSPAEQEKLFQKFTRGQSSYAAAGGLGIGLYICKKFIEGHSGKIWVKSDGVGRGSEFGFSLPFKGKNSMPEAVDLVEQDAKIK